MSGLQATFFHAHASAFFVSTAFVLALSLTATPSLLPLVLLLALLRIYVTTVAPRAVLVHVVLWITMTVGISLAHLLPSLHALSTPTISIITLLLLSALSSAVPLALILLDHPISARVQSPWSQITLFPAIWATVWSGVAYVSPLGRLTTWSPIYGLESYTWMTRLTGGVGTDWVVAGWAVIGAHAIDTWLLSDVRGEEPLIPHELPADASRQSSVSKSPKLALLGIILVALALPSFFTHDLPLPPFSSNATPLIVGCVLPTGRSQEFTPTLDDFIAESKKMTSAKVLLWPEGAVKFNSPSEKEEALNRIRQEVRGPYVGVSFEDFVPSEGGRSGMRRTGVSIVSNDSDETLLSYYKRQLVPSKLPPLFLLAIPECTGRSSCGILLVNTIEGPSSNIHVRITSPIWH